MHQLHLNPEPHALLILAAIWMVPALLAWFLARSRERNPWIWGPVCLLAPVMLFALVALPTRRDAAE